MLLILNIKYQSQLSYNSFILTLVSGSDAILLGAETLRGLYPVETISTVGKICAEVKGSCRETFLFSPFLWFRLPFNHIDIISPERFMSQSFRRTA